MRTLAAVLVELGSPLVLADLEIPPLRAGQVLVDVAYSGVCHTQLLEIRGGRGTDPYLPHCLGHEGSGTVLAIGTAVVKVKQGDRVILSWMRGSGAEAGGATYRWGDRQVNAGGVTTFGRQAVVSENRLTSIPEGIAMRDAALLGCAIPTGFGAVFNTAHPVPGQSIAIFGTGGIGLCAVAAATIAGCVPVVAIDARAERLDAAAEMGASITIDASRTDVLQDLDRIAPGGLDFAVEATGRTEVMLQALRAVRPRGGVAVIVGNARHGDVLCVDPKELNNGKRLVGTWGGDSSPDRDFPRYAQLLRFRRLALDQLVRRVYPLSEINRALTDLETGVAIRPLIDMNRQ